MIKRILVGDKSSHPIPSGNNIASCNVPQIDTPLASLEQCKDTVGWIIIFLKTSGETTPAILESISELLQTLQTISVLLGKIIGFISINGTVYMIVQL